MRKTLDYKVMKARGAIKNILEHIEANVQGGAESAPPGPFRVNMTHELVHLKGSYILDPFILM